jgi:hypothetical protein
MYINPPIKAENNNTLIIHPMKIHARRPLDGKNSNLNAAAG